MIDAIERVFFGYFLSSVAYVGLFSLAARLIPTSRQKKADALEYKKIALLVPAYQEDQVILSVIEHLLKQDYPTDRYDIVLIADAFEPATISKLRQYPIIVLEVAFEQSTKVKSLNYALNRLEDSYDIAIVSDADNIPEYKFLAKINQAYQMGYRIIQGKRVAKNQDTPFALLDAANEIINNHIFRRGFNALGLSSALIGSGMAFPFGELKYQLNRMHAVGGFDKELQLALIEKGLKVRYLEHARIFDEKIETAQAFENQRRRWLSSQYIYLRKYFAKGLKQLLRGNVSYFNIAILYNLFLPRMLNIGALLVVATGATLLQEYLSIPYIYWWLLPLCYGVALIIALPLKFFNRDLWRAIGKLPHALTIMTRSFLRMKGANRRFIHTAHTKTEIDSSIFSQE